MWTLGQAPQQVQTQAQPCLQWPRALRAVSACSGLQGPSPRSPLSCMQTRGSWAGAAEGRRCPWQPVSKMLHHLLLSFSILSSPGILEPQSWAESSMATPTPRLRVGASLGWGSPIGPRVLRPHREPRKDPRATGEGPLCTRTIVAPTRPLSYALSFLEHRPGQPTVSCQPSLLQEPPTAHACPSHRLL